MCLQIKNKIGVVLAALLCSAPTMATPITYTFTTGAFGADYRNDFASTPNARALVSPDAYVSGSFIYDPDGPYLHEALATDSTGASFQGAAYQGIYNIEGTLHMSSLGSSYAFNTAQGAITVYDNIVVHFTGTGTPYSYSYDVLALGASPSTGPINGFTLGGLPLYSFNLAWIEQPSWHNFLDSIALPNSLPTFVGQVTLSLGTLDADGRASDRVFFNSLTVTPVPLPGAAMLFMSSLFGLVTGARLRKRGNLTA